VTAHVSDGVNVRAGCLENAQTKESEHGDQGEVVDVSESRDALSIASNCRWLRPRVGDSGETWGRRTYSAGECSRSPSITQVR
jgi:hypothetical protein